LALNSQELSHIAAGRIDASESQGQTGGKPMSANQEPLGVELDNYARRVVGTCPWAEFVGIQRNFKSIADPLILLRHCKLRGSAVAVRLGQLNEFNVTLAVSAQFYRYHRSLFE
jgi:hypothetical protein